MSILFGLNSATFPIPDDLKGRGKLRFPTANGSRFGDRSYRWNAYGRRELRFPTAFKTHQLSLDEALAQVVNLSYIHVTFFDYNFH